MLARQTDWKRRGVGAMAGNGSATAFLLRRMRREFDQIGKFSTWLAMYGAYAAHAGLSARAAYRHAVPLPLPSVIATEAGSVALACGVGMLATGMRRFSPVLSK